MLAGAWLLESGAATTFSCGTTAAFCGLLADTAAKVTAESTTAAETSETVNFFIKEYHPFRLPGAQGKP
ncbi:hypothetical protein BBD42_04750 [Paenibacillus sp. BIHB 4019]|uniref:Uncharacterized protein n=1 Tax=Paenibacillus sp. BIHB 4019 TaxID=1870819 RepID=A0A1B2DDQ9_9BACL|nr:hypothetical protein BBD42_04750 [Paenibacillus sp. BIHB 4019]